MKVYIAELYISDEYTSIAIFSKFSSAQKYQKSIMQRLKRKYPPYKNVYGQLQYMAVVHIYQKKVRE